MPRQTRTEAIEEEFWKIDPALIYSIFEHKVDMAKEIVRLGGDKVKKQPHAGARRRTKLAVEKARGDVQVSGSSSDEGSSSDDDLDFVGRILD